MPESTEVKIDEATLKEQIAPLSEEQNEALADAALAELELENETPEAKKEREEAEEAETQAQTEKAAGLAVRAKEAGLSDTATEDEINSAELKSRAKAAGLGEDANLEDVETKELAVRAKAIGLAEDASLEEVEAKEAEEPKPTDEEAQKKKDIEEAERIATEADAATIKALMEPDKDGKKIAETEELAKEILDKDKAVVKKFDSEPYKLARGYRDLQSRADKAEQQVKNAQGIVEQIREESAANAVVDLPAVKNLIMDGKISDGKGGHLTEAQVIDATKKQHPSQTKDKEDDELLEFAAEKIRDAYARSQDSLKADRKVKASAKRDEVLSKLPDDAKEFEAEVKVEVNKFSDAQILSPTFDLVDVIRWAKGNKYDALKTQVDKARQEGHDAGFKKGKEEAVALGEKTPGPKSKGKAKVDSSGLARTINAKEQKRALEMFDHLKLTDKEKYKEYIDLYPKENEEFE